MPRLPRAIVVLGIVSLLNDVAGEMVQPLVPLYLAALGASAIAIGAVEGAAETAVSLVQAWAGRTADRIRRRKPLVAVGYGVAGLAKSAMAAATSWPVALVLRTADRVGKGLRGPPRDAMIADLSHPARRGLSFGYHRAADSTGAVLGPIIAVAILGVLGTSMTSMRIVFLMAGLPVALALVLLLFGVREEPVERLAPAKGTGPLTRPVKVYLAIVALFGLGQANYAFFVLRAQDLGAGVATALWLYVGYNTVYASASVPMGTLSDRYGRRPLLAAAFVLFAIAAAGFAFTARLDALLPWFIFYGLFQAAFETVSRAYAADLAPATARGTVLGAYHAVIGVTALPAGIIAGLLWEGVQPAAPFLVGSGAALVCAAAMWLLPATLRERTA